MILYLIGAIQGLLTSIILLTRRPRTLSLILLSALLISLSLQLGLLGYYSKIVGIVPGVRVLGWVLPFVFAPITYLYLRSYLTGHTLRRADLTHVFPVLLGSLMCLPYFDLPKEEQIALQILEDPLFFKIALAIESMRVFQSMLYGILSFKLFRKSVKEAKSSLSNFDLRWLGSFLGFNILAWIMALVGTLFYFLEFGFPNVYNILYAFIVISIYLLSWKLMGQSDFQPKQENPSGEKYSNNPLSPEIRSQYLTKLEACMMQEQLFKNSQLRLQDLADHLDIPAHHLSQTINSELNQNFYDYVNSQRIEHVKTQFRDPSQNHLKIIAIAFDAGFNSKSTFNTIFKKSTGKTPSAFRYS